MALATKCPHCNTIFRVAADQLKLRGGIVRCGACQEVFDGNAALLDPAAPAQPVTAIPPAPAMIAPSAADDASDYALDFDISYDPYGTLPDYAQRKSAPAPAAPVTPQPQPVAAAPAPLAEPAMPASPVAAIAPAPAQTTHDVWRKAPIHTAPEEIAAPPVASAAPGAEAAATVEPAASAATESAAETIEAEDVEDTGDAGDEPGFVKQGRRRQRTGKALRVLMAIGLLPLLAALLVQGVGTFRNQLASQVPQLKPALVQICAVLGCRVELPAQIEQLSIEQGELQTLAEQTFSYATVLRNAGNSTQAWPHLELILNDGNDKAVLRRVVAPRDYLPATLDVSKGFPPRSEQAVKLYFELAQLKAAGYHIAIFYP
ncbi:zinc-ribbon and DUF3426 domain-containing protein [Janthinobacterium fluminis]|uniref:Zinc-ribbon and DUF3426 domain-containing protein n=1 Tax=Janthinobacterium fluminis TaxID=2987524 RepID=A0ABT5K233_9BURK|nr:zinc-ribbon and DUF3426 domain-containing protein [Janthinobacterium fluminis]MDC8758730.1 zinc-ribbon and DUF3426 domain-containing protein [Janthinobacterium fluminis]